MGRAMAVAASDGEIVAPADEQSQEKPTAVYDAASSGDWLALLVATRNRIAKAVDDPDTPARDLAALSKRVLEISREIEALEGEAKADGGGEDGSDTDEAFDPEVL